MHFRRSIPFWLLSLFAACASPPTLYDPGELTSEQKQVVIEALAALRDGEPYDEQRRAIQANPTMAFKFTRILVLELNSQREARVTGSEKWRAPYDQAVSSAAARQGSVPDADLLRSAAGQGNPVEQRALAALDAMGAAAVPCLIEDLAKHRQTYFRQMGVELLGRLGEQARPAVAELSTSSDPSWRRTAAQALGAMPADVDTFTLLRSLSDDRDYGVRAEALKASPTGDPRSAPWLRGRVLEDEDPFVRRAAAKALASFSHVETAEVLILYLERCKDERDGRGADAAQDSLQALARKRGVRSAAAWRRWARGYRPEAGS